MCVCVCASFCRRQESQYEMTGLYSEAQDDSSADLPQDTETDSLPSRVVAVVQQPQTVTVSTTLTNPSVTTTCITSSTSPDTVIKCHSRQPSASLMDREKSYHSDATGDEMSRDCGILSCRPVQIQKLARIKVSGRMWHILNESDQSISSLLLDFRAVAFDARDASAGAQLGLH
jgi:organic anion transporter 3A